MEGQQGREPNSSQIRDLFLSNLSLFSSTSEGERILTIIMTHRVGRVGALYDDRVTSASLSSKRVCLYHWPRANAERRD